MTKSVRQLTTLFTPTVYNLSIDISKRVERTFTGSVALTGSLLQASTAIILHSKDLTITSATIDGAKATWKAGKDDELALRAPQELAAGEHELAIDFTGTVTDPMHGLYPSYFTHDGKKKELLMTQLESHYAREVFPCIDEPAAKAVFNLTLVTEPGVTVLANTPERTSEATGNSLTTTFEPTPNMSPYLLAFVVGELGFTETTNANGVVIRAYATPDNVKHTKFALDFTAKALEFYDEYFGVPYPLPKCDLVAVPDFSAGAMENWGLITFRENALLYDEQNTPADTREWIASATAHELAHQWFGNLVTMQWWDDLWLNESFARWMENYCVDKLYPEWQVWTTFGAREQQAAFNRDGLANVQAVREKVNHPDEIHSLFDPAIVYAKGACLIRMLHAYLGDDAFRDGMRVYMKAHQYANADANDLWAALDSVTKKDVSAFMSTWVQQPGHPVVHVSMDGDQVHLAQNRFYVNPRQAQATQSLYPVPLLSKSIDAELFTDAKATYNVTAPPLMLNNDFVGFYHTHYDSDTIAQIAERVKNGDLSEITRQSLLVDGIALARAGVQSTADTMKLLTAYQQESSYAVWQAMTTVIGAVRTIVNEDEALRPQLRAYVASLANDQYNRLGWERKADESYFDELLRPTVISLMAYAEVPEVVQRLLDMFDAAKKPEDIALPELRSIVYSVAIRERGQAAYNILLGWYKTAQSADERVNLIAGITSMRDPEIAKQATALFTTKAVRPQDLAYWFIYTIRNRYARDVAWQWMQDSWPWITKQFKNSHDYGDFPKYSASAFVTKEHLQAYKAFFEPKLNETDIAILIHQGIEEIEARVMWRERDLPAVTELLKSIPVA